MINAGIVGLGWWGRVLVQSGQSAAESLTFTHGSTRTRSKVQAFADEQGFALVDTYEELLADDDVDAVVLATPHSQHRAQIEAAAAAGKHVFCEKPITLTKADAEACFEACDKTGVVCAVGFNRRFHPAIAETQARIQDDKLGTLLHAEGTMTAPNGMFLAADAWRADKRETPIGGLTPMGVHLMDVYIHLFGEIDEVYCQSFRRAVPNDTDDTSSILFRMKNGMSAYLGTMLATQVAFRFQVFGTGGWIEIKEPDLSVFEFVPNGDGPIKGQPGALEPETLDFSGFDMVGAELEAFAQACGGGAPYAVTAEEAIHGIAVLEAIVKSAESGTPQKVG